MSRVVLVELGDDGWLGLPERLRGLLAGADVLVGEPALLADVPASFAQAREPWPTPLRPGLVDLLNRHHGHGVVGVVAVGSLRSALARELGELLGPQLRVEPAVPAEVLAAARLGWPGDVDVVDLHDREPHVLLRELADGRRLLVLPGADAADELATTVAVILRAVGYAGSRMVAWSGLGTTRESAHDATASTWGAAEARTDVLALDLVGPLTSPWLAGLPDAAYAPQEHLTPRDLRAAALARLAPQPGQLLWDLGSGGGCVAIEWLRAHRQCRALVVEPDAAGVAAVHDDAHFLGVAPEIVPGAVPSVLAGRPAPDAVFVGPGHVRRTVLDACLGVLRPGGRIVVHAASTQAEALLGETYAASGGELTRLAVDVATWSGSAARWTSRPPVTQWAWQS